MDKAKLAAIFNEWARRFAENPEWFGPILDAEGQPISDYGQRCAEYFAAIEHQLSERISS